MVYVPIVPFMHDDEVNIDLTLGSAIVKNTKRNGTMYKQDDKVDWLGINLPFIFILIPVIVCLFIVIFGGME